MTDSTEGRIYPPVQERREMRGCLLRRLRARPARYTASALVAAIREGDVRHSERSLTLELSRMMGSTVRLNPDRTLSLYPWARH